MNARRWKKSTLVILTISMLLLLLAVLFVPYSVSHYDDGGTVRIQALTYVVIKWDRELTELDANGDPIAQPPQKTCVYWLPDQLKSYEELWAIRH